MCIRDRLKIKLNFLSLLKRSLIYKLKKKVNVDLDGIEYSSLDKLFSHYGTDKSEYSNDKKNKTHGFSRYYEKHLSFIKDKKIKILEIGSFSGASAAAFSSAYFANFASRAAFFASDLAFFASILAFNSSGLKFASLTRD